MHHNIVDVDQHPLGIFLAFDAHRPEAFLFGTLSHTVGNGAHMAIGIAGSDDHTVGHIGDVADVDHLDVDRLHIFEGGDYGLDECGPSRRAAGFTFSHWRRA